MQGCTCQQNDRIMSSCMCTVVYVKSLTMFFYMLSYKQSPSELINKPKFVKHVNVHLYFSSCTHNFI